MEDSTQPRHDVDYYEVRPSPDKGLGAFAVKEIPSGSLILAEAPTIILMQEPLDIRDADIEAALLTLTEAQRTAFYDLSAPPTQYSSLLLRTFLGNSMSPAAIPGSTCLCLQIARFNHSCRPNSEMAWNPFTSTFDLYAIRTIGADEEILWNYIPGSNYMPTSYRRFLQFLNWRFVCNCETCVGSYWDEDQAFRRRSDRWRMCMYILNNHLTGFELSTLGRNTIIERGISIEETWKPGELDTILEELWQPSRELPEDARYMEPVLSPCLSGENQYRAWRQLASWTTGNEDEVMGKELALAYLNVVDFAIRQPESIDNDLSVGAVDHHMGKAMEAIKASRPRAGPDVQAFESKAEQWTVVRQQIRRRLDFDSTNSGRSEHRGTE